MNSRLYNDLDLNSEDGLDVSKVEEILKRYEHVVESFMWNTYDIGYHEELKKLYQILEITSPTSVSVTSHSRYKTIKTSVIGTTPNSYDSLKKDYLDIYYSGSSLTLAEQLYTINGSDS